MIHGQNTRIEPIVPPQAIKDNGSYTSTAFDLLNADYAEVIVYIGATDIAASACKIQECDTSGGSYADVTGLVYGTSTNIAGSTSSLPAAGDDDSFFKFEIDTRIRKRYLKIVLTIGDGTTGAYCCVIGIASRMNEAPSTAALAGCADILRL